MNATVCAGKTSPSRLESTAFFWSLMAKLLRLAGCCRLRRALDPCLKTGGKAAGDLQKARVWPAPTKSGHMDHSSVKKQHRACIQKPRPIQAIERKRICAYSFRHTFLTRLGESGCDAWNNGTDCRLERNQHFQNVTCIRLKTQYWPLLPEYLRPKDGWKEEQKFKERDGVSI